MAVLRRALVLSLVFRRIQGSSTEAVAAGAPPPPPPPPSAPQQIKASSAATLRDDSSKPPPLLPPSAPPSQAPMHSAMEVTADGTYTTSHGEHTLAPGVSRSEICAQNTVPPPPPQLSTPPQTTASSTTTPREDIWKPPPPQLSAPPQTAASSATTPRENSYSKPVIDLTVTHSTNQSSRRKSQILEALRNSNMTMSSPHQRETLSSVVSGSSQKTSARHESQRIGHVPSSNRRASVPPPPPPLPSASSENRRPRDRGSLNAAGGQSRGTRRQREATVLKQSHQSPSHVGQARRYVSSCTFGDHVGF